MLVSPASEAPESIRAWRVGREKGTGKVGSIKRLAKSQFSIMFIIQMGYNDNKKFEEKGI